MTDAPQRDEVVYRIGRDAITGRFISVAEAKRRPDTTVVVTIRRKRTTLRTEKSNAL